MNYANFAFLSLGSNLGDAVLNLRWACQRLAGFSAAPLLQSSLWRTSPVDCPPGSPAFINAVVGLSPLPLETPETLVQKCQAMELEFGRPTARVHHAPRPLDLDLLVFGQEQRSTAALMLPHPRALQRRFVLAPLAELAPALVFPGETRTVAECLATLQSVEVVERL